jgi:hypothetical protein
MCASSNGLRASQVAVGQGQGHSPDTNEYGRAIWTVNAVNHDGVTFRRFGRPNFTRHTLVLRRFTRCPTIMLEFLACLDKTLLKHLLGSGGRSIASTIARHERGNHQLSRSALISFIAALSNAVTLRRCGNYLGRGDHA